jgi:hypothetical protein
MNNNNNNNNNNNSIQFNSILVYLRANLTALRPITKLARVRETNTNTYKQNTNNNKNKNNNNIEQLVV